VGYGSGTTAVPDQIFQKISSNLAAIIQQQVEDRLYRIFKAMIQRALRQILSEELPPLIEKIRTREPKLLTYSEAQVRLNVSKPIFFKILREKRLHTVVLEERTYRIDSIELEDFIERQKHFKN
jgi:hypothetical protein